MRRRNAVAEAAQVAAGEPPEHLRSMHGVESFRAQADAEPAPEWVQPGEAKRWRQVHAYGLWLAARREWCKECGLDYWTTFHRTFSEIGGDLADEGAPQ